MSDFKQKYEYEDFGIPGLMMVFFVSILFVELPLGFYLLASGLEGLPQFQVLAGGLGAAAVLVPALMAWMVKKKPPRPARIIKAWTWVRLVYLLPLLGFNFFNNYQIALAASDTSHGNQLRLMAILGMALVGGFVLAYSAGFWFYLGRSPRAKEYLSQAKAGPGSSDRPPEEDE